MKRCLGIVGAGRVGRGLGRSLRQLGWKIGAVVAQSEASARRAVRFIGGGTPCGEINPLLLLSPIILVAVPDEAIASVAEKLAGVGGEEWRGKIVLHTSGALNSSELCAVQNRGAHCGSMHPLQTFTGIGMPPLDGRIFAVEGDAVALGAARQMARALGASPVYVAREKKAIYHAAAALAAGHLLALEEAAMQLMIAAGMKRREAAKALLSLSRRVLDNDERLGPRASWTGPQARGDFAVVAEHWEALQKFPPEFSGAYQALSLLGEKLLAHESPGRTAELMKIFSSVKVKVKASGENA